MFARNVQGELGAETPVICERIAGCTFALGEAGRSNMFVADICHPVIRRLGGLASGMPEEQITEACKAVRSAQT